MKRSIDLYHASISLKNTLLCLFWWFITFWRKPALYRAKLIELLDLTYHTGGWYLFGSARSSLSAFLKAAGIGRGDEVVLSSYTCLAVPTAIVAVGANPVYVDIDFNSLSIDKIKIWEAVSDKTKAIIVQHTLGIPASVDEIKHEAYDRDILVIEDCALAIGSKLNGILVGTTGDASIFSMELSKTLSCGWGGLLLINNPKLVHHMTQFYGEVPEQEILSSTFDLLQTIISTWCEHPIFINFPGKYLMWLLNKLRIFRPSTPSSEFGGVVGENFIHKMGGAQTLLAILQWNVFTKITGLCATNHKIFRKELKSLGYHVNGEDINNAEYVANRVSFLVNNKTQIREYFQKEKIVLGEWFDGPLTPVPSAPVFNYQAGIFPKAELIASHVVNLPCHNRLSEFDVDHMIRVLRNYTQSNPEAISVYNFSH
ncbi:MAG: hypothetical protein HOK41_02125 [Nitrospina sp.]|jgi:perosamine synthetase|nr:hypothetical protein [Nitrospina sp.]